MTEVKWRTADSQTTSPVAAKPGRHQAESLMNRINGVLVARLADEAEGGGPR
jgi:hypothetical protein